MDPVTFVQTMYANGAKGFFDALSYHPYNYSKTFAEQNPGFLSPLQMLLQMRQTMLDNGDDLIKIWASEYGLPTSLNADQAAAYQNQLKFISDFLNVWGDGLTDAQLAQLPQQYQDLAATWKDWIGPAFIYSLRDRLGQEMTEQGSFGLYYFDEASGEWKMKPAAEWIRDLIKSRQSNDLAAALAASLQKLVQQVATSVQQTVVNQVAPAVQQTVQKIGSQVGNALANALAAWAASLKKTPTTTTTVAAIQAVDTAAVAEQAVTESFPATETATEKPSTTTEKLSAADDSATEKASVDHATEDKPATSDQSKVTAPTATANEAGDDATPKPAASDDTKTSDDSKATAPANRKENEDDAKGGDSKKDGDKKSGGDKKGAGGSTATGKHARGSVKNGTSVDEIKTKLGDDTAKSPTGAPKHAASDDASASAAG
jgi:hypothetical protein